MPITYVIDKAESTIFTTATGHITSQDIIDYTLKIIDHPDYRPGMNELFDLRQVEKFDVSAEAITNAVVIEQNNANRIGAGKFAVVSAGEVEYGVMRMYQILSENAAFEINVFRDINEARKWLRLPEEIS